MIKNIVSLNHQSEKHDSEIHIMEFKNRVKRIGQAREDERI